MAKLSKAQRIEEKFAGGMTYIEAEISIVQEDNAAKVAVLKAKQEREEAKVRSIIVELLEAQHPDEFRTLQAEARAKLLADAQLRSSRANGARVQAVSSNAGAAPTMQHVQTIDE